MLVLAACSDDDGSDVSSGGESTADQPTIVATHSILGDLVENVVGDEATVDVLMPPGADPHDFEPSAQQIAQLQEADLVVANGLHFEEGLDDAIDQAEDAGAPVLFLGDELDPIPFSGPHTHDHDDDGDDHADDDHDHAEDGEDDHADDEVAAGADADADEHGDETGAEDGEDDHADEDATEDGEDEHADDDLDPHWFTDPQRAAAAVGLIAEAVQTETDLDVSAGAEAYAAELTAADAAIEAQLAEIDEDQRVLITNHEVFGYFAERYDFEVVGVIIPGGDTLAEPSSAALADLVEEIEHEGVSAIFADSSASTSLADTLAAETGQDVVVVELFTESLGEPGSGGETYLELIQTNADRITEALG